MPHKLKTISTLNSSQITVIIEPSPIVPYSSQELVQDNYHNHFHQGMEQVSSQTTLANNLSHNIDQFTEIKNQNISMSQDMLPHVVNNIHDIKHANVNDTHGIGYIQYQTHPPMQFTTQPQAQPPPSSVQANIQNNNNLQRQLLFTSQAPNLTDQQEIENCICQVL
ncbi:14575_t:CDS:2 [Cetraspora pellucida]|uniref:14575_t:CDS:1 n=1 Tax=Cetraspora pellucida TaxID=1433469 RepID=A0A9N9NI72_9GLOM|nr:14575_t:CDS:2 [Cetraspora pellucida]